MEPIETTPRRYARSPLSEAVCEFRFVPSRDWDWTIPGLAYSKLGTAYPEKRQVGSLQISLAPESGVLAQQLSAIDRIQFLGDGQKSLVQLGPDLLAVNRLAPYSGWPAFAVTIREALAVYVDIANPVSLARVGLRYINRFEIPETSVDMDDYFRAQPRLPAEIPQEFGLFAMTVDVSYQTAMMRFSLAQIPSESPTLSYVCDLDFNAAGDDAPSFDGVAAWLTEAHSRVESAFVATFTDKTHREVFGLLDE